MKLLVFSIRDAKAEAFMRPFFAPTRGFAIRNFADEVRGDSPLGKHPDDYTLFELGSFDETTGELTKLEQPYSLGLASMYREV